MKFYEYEHYKVNEYSYGYKSFDNDDLQQESMCSITPDGIYDVNDKQFQKDSVYQQNNIPNYLFFKPFFFFSDKKWHLFKNTCNRYFEFSSENIIKKEEHKKKEYGLELNFLVDIEQNSFKYDTFEIIVDKVVNQYEFLKYLESFRVHSNYYLTFNPFKNLVSNFSIHDGYLNKEDFFLLSGTIFFNFDIKAKEKISISFNKQYAKKVKKNNYFIKIPNYLFFEEYDDDKDYYVDDVVFYTGGTYRCIKNCKKIVPSENKEFWTIIKNIEKSFLNSLDGKKTLDFLKDQLGILVEQKISDEITLNFANTDIMPNLNDSFKFNDKCYRIIEIFKKNIEGYIYLTIKGVEILKFNDIAFDKITEEFDKKYDSIVNRLNFKKIDNSFEVCFLDRLSINHEKNFELTLERPND